MESKNNTSPMSTRYAGKGNRLYEKWWRVRNMPHDPKFDEFKSFHDWSMRHGYTPDAKLVKINKSKPFGPKNCAWQVPEGRVIYGDEAKEWCRKWHEAINRIRLHYGMEPLTLEDVEEAKIAKREGKFA